MQIVCGQCRHLFHFDGGRAAPCPKCGHEILVEAELSAAAPAADADIEIEDFANAARHTMDRKLHLKCGHCGKALTVGARLAGKKRKCPACQKKVQIPYPDDKEDFGAVGTFAMLAAEADSLDLVKEDKPAAPAAAPAPPKAPHRPRKEPRETPAVVVEMPAGDTSADEAADVFPQFTPPRRRRRRRGRPSTIGAGLFIAILAFAGTYWAYDAMNRKPSNPELAAGAPSPKPSQAAAPTASKAPSASPAPSPSAAAVARATPSPSPSGLPSGEVPGRLKITGATRSPFLGEGYHAAGPLNLFVAVTVEITAGTYAMTVSPTADVFVSVDGTDTAAIGTLTSGLVGPTTSNAAISLKPNQAGAATFVFELSQNLTGVMLRMRGAGEQPLTLEPLKFDRSAELSGSYVESPPRNLPPLPREPILAALAGTQQIQMRILSAGGDYDVSFAVSGITGTFKRMRPGLYSGDLKLGNSSLACKLRMIDGSKSLLLYLRDEPFHQITFVRE